MTKDLTMQQLGLEYYNVPVVAVRIHRTDNQWLVEYKKLAKRWWKPWDYFWWYNDGKYVNYWDASDRAMQIASDGFVRCIRYVKTGYTVEPKE